MLNNSMIAKLWQNGRFYRKINDCTFLSSVHFPLYVREGFFWSLPSIYTYLTDQCILDPAAVHRYAVTMSYRSHASQIPATRAFLRKLDVCPSGWNWLLFVQRFSAGAAILRTQKLSDTFDRPRIYTRYLQRRTPRRAAPHHDRRSAGTTK